MDAAAMSGTAIGAVKVAASKLGISQEDYQSHLDAGLKWCTACKTWHGRVAFLRDRSRGDGLKASCLMSERGQPRGTRDASKERARYEVNLAVRYGRLPAAVLVPCADCGHIYEQDLPPSQQRRHEYDHYLGYEPEHRLHVQVVCTLCHADREKSRGR